MNTDETLRKYWKIQRDISKRGYSKEKILAQITSREHDSKKYIHPQKDLADLVIEYYDTSLTNCMTEHHVVKLSVKYTLSVDINLEPLISELQKYGIEASYDYSEDLQKQVIVFTSENLQVHNLPIMDIGEQVIPQFNELSLNEQTDECDSTAILILLLFTIISHKMRDAI